MKHLRPIWILIGLLLLASLACQALVPEAEPEPPVIGGAPPPIPTTTGAATFEPAATMTATAVITQVTPLPTTEASVTARVDLNIRQGPGTEFAIVGFLPAGRDAAVVGVDQRTGWWKIQCPPDVEGDECWVSGGPQFTRIDEPEGVPIVSAPATPTPATTAAATGEAPAGGAFITYIESGDVWVRSLLAEDTTITAGPARRLTDQGNVSEVLAGPDGRWIAYTGAAQEGNYLALTSTAGGGHQLLVESVDLPDPGADRVNVIDQVVWLPDGEGLLFNTSHVFQSGPGVGSNEDLWQVNLNGDLVDLFAAGQGGGAFALSAAGQLLMASDTEIIRANLDGSGREVVATFPFIVTASEYIYYPRPQWTADGSQGYVAIPDPEPFDFDAPEPTGATLWQIPTSGRAVEIGRLTGNILFHPVFWSPSGDRLARVRQVGDETPQLIIASGAGRDPQPTGSADSGLRFFEWHPAGSHFLYGASTGHALGIVGGMDIPAPSAGGGPAIEGQWLDATHYVVLEAAPSGWRFGLGDLAGMVSPLFEAANENPPSFDLWAP